MRLTAARGASPAGPAASAPAGRVLSAPSLITERKILHASTPACRARPPSLVQPGHDAYELVEADGRAEYDAGDHQPAGAEVTVERPAQPHARQHREEDRQPRRVRDAAAARRRLLLTVRLFRLALGHLRPRLFSQFFAPEVCEQTLGLQHLGLGRRERGLRLLVRAGDKFISADPGERD